MTRNYRPKNVSAVEYFFFLADVIFLSPVRHFSATIGLCHRQIFSRHQSLNRLWSLAYLVSFIGFRFVFLFIFNMFLFSFDYDYFFPYMSFFDYNVSFAFSLNFPFNFIFSRWFWNCMFLKPYENVNNSLFFASIIFLHLVLRCIFLNLTKK